MLAKFASSRHPPPLGVPTERAKYLFGRFLLAAIGVKNGYARPAMDADALGMLRSGASRRIPRAWTSGGEASARWNAKADPLPTAPTAQLR